MVQRWEGVIVKEKFLKMPANNKKSDACSGWLLDFIQENGKDIAGVQRTGNSMGKWERNIDVVVGGFEEKIDGNGFDILLLLLSEQKKHVLIVVGWLSFSFITTQKSSIDMICFWIKKKRFYLGGRLILVYEFLRHPLLLLLRRFFHSILDAFSGGVSVLVERSSKLHNFHVLLEQSSSQHLSHSLR